MEEMEVGLETACLVEERAADLEGERAAKLDWVVAVEVLQVAEVPAVPREGVMVAAMAQAEEEDLAAEEEDLAGLAAAGLAAAVLAAAAAMALGTVEVMAPVAAKGSSVVVLAVAVLAAAAAVDLAEGLAVAVAEGLAVAQRVRGVTPAAQIRSQLLQ